MIMACLYKCNKDCILTRQICPCNIYPLKLRVRLGTCKIDLSPPVILYYLLFQGDTSVVVLSFYVLVFKIFCAVGALCMISYLGK